MAEERRSLPWRRMRQALGATMTEESHVVALAYVSQTGARGTTEAALNVGDRVALRLPCVGDKASVVEWVQDQAFGCRFLVPLRYQDVDRAAASEATMTIRA